MKTFLFSSNLYSRLIVRQILIQNRPRESLDKISLERMRKPNFKLSVALNFSLKVDQDAYQTLKKMLHNYDTRVRPNYTGNIHRFVSVAMRLNVTFNGLRSFCLLLSIINICSIFDVTGKI